MRTNLLAVLFLASTALSSQSLVLYMNGGISHPLRKSSNMSTSVVASNVRNNFRKTGEFIAAGLRIGKPEKNNLQGILEMRIIQQPFNTSNFITQYNLVGPEELSDLTTDSWQTISLLMGAVLNKELSDNISLEMNMQMGGSQLESPTIHTIGLRENFIVPQRSQLALTAVLGSGINIKLAENAVFHLSGDVMLNVYLNGGDPAIRYLYYPFYGASIPLNLKAGMSFWFPE